ncbi:MAG: hypothetical protein ACI4XF_04100 [Oscillospiraceae bacterium]
MGGFARAAFCREQIADTVHCDNRAVEKYGIIIKELIRYLAIYRQRFKVAVTEAADGDTLFFVLCGRSFTFKADVGRSSFNKYFTVMLRRLIFTAQIMYIFVKRNYPYVMLRYFVQTLQNISSLLYDKQTPLDMMSALTLSNIFHMN